MAIAPHDDLIREAYGILGIPIDAVDMAGALREVETAIVRTAPFLISTANLNFLTTSRSDPAFRESLLVSDLCTADGMPIVWIARLLGAPIEKRIAGSDLFEALKNRPAEALPVKAFFFGGEPGAAAAACQSLNTEAGLLTCAGFYDPGFGTVDAMSTNIVLGAINSSDANFVAAALGAKKGQAWLLHNHDRLRIPVRVHLGATINFQAGTINRAPARIASSGFEWLWRIKEEPHLWRRYGADGVLLMKLLFTQLIPLMILNGWHRFKERRNAAGLLIRQADSHNSVTLSIDGIADARHVNHATEQFKTAVATSKDKDIVINFAHTGFIDARFLGLLLMLNKVLKRQRRHLTFTGVPPRIKRLFRLNGFGFLLCEHNESVA